MNTISKRLVGRLAGLLFIGSGLLTLAYLFLPTPEMLSRTALIVITSAAVAIGLFALVAPWDRWPRWVSLLLILPAFVLIAVGNYFGSTEPWTFGIFFVVAFVWLGMAHPRWTSTKLALPAAVAYIAPIVIRADASPLGASSAVITIPVAVLVGESIAWIASRERRSHERAEALARTAVAVSSHLAEDDVLHTLVEEARRALRAEHAVLTTLDPETLTVRGVYMAGIDPQFQRVISTLRGISYGDFVARRALEGSDEPIVVNDAEDSDVLPAEVIGMIRAKSFMLIPLQSGNELVGVLSCGESSRKRRYAGEDVALARALGSQARAAMRNAALYEQTLQAANCDSLTGLGNRGAFHKHLEVELERARRYGRELSLVLLDTDNFKLVNDGWGHQAGDRVLVRLANFLERTIRQGDAAYRIGGDEFALLLPETGPTGAANLAERIRRLIERARLGVGEELALSVSMGVSSYPHHGTSVDELFSVADTMLYEVKANEGNAVAVVSARRHGRGATLFGLDVQKILLDRRVLPSFQPIVDLRTAAVAGYEAFCRLDPALGATPTPTLLRAAGALGMLESLDDVCREIALDATTQLPADALLFINVAPASLESPGFAVDQITDALRGRDISPARVVVEVIEHGRSPHSAALWTSLEACRDAGLKIALDDLGAGAADLDLLGRIPFDFVKVDIALSGTADVPESRRRLLQGLQLLVTETGAKAVAESVETLDDLHLVVDMGFDAAQGYVLGAPSQGFATPSLSDLVDPRRAG